MTCTIFPVVNRDFFDTKAEYFSVWYFTVRCPTIPHSSALKKVKMEFSSPVFVGKVDCRPNEAPP